MPSLFGQVCADFQVVGELHDKRIITSNTQKDWALYILKISTIGCTLEIHVTKDEYEQAVMRAPYQIKGHFKVEAKRTNLIADEINLLSQKTA